MSLEAGKLEHRVRFQRLVAEVDSDGEQVQLDDGTLVSNWQTIHQCWAEVAPISAREFIQSNATQAMIVARVTIRWTAVPIDASCRMVFRRKIYNVEGTLPDKVSGLEYVTLPVSNLGEEESVQEETNYLLTASGDFLTTASGDSLTWS